MSIKKSAKLFLIVFALGLLLTLIGLASKKAGIDKSPAINFASAKEELSKMFEGSGSKETYEYFRENYAASDPLIAHELAHFVGGELYKYSGAEGISVCDDILNWGCYHGFFGASFKKEGQSLLARADEACRKKGQNPLDFGGCVHGIGHGVLAVNGYELENLIKALKMCDLLSSDGAKGCYNGVFMEYNTRTMQHLREGESPIREFNPKDPHEPCNKLPAPYRADCYFEQPAWWAIVIPGDFSRMGNFCVALKEKEREKCFSGVGRVAPSKLDYSTKEVGEICAKMPDTLGARQCMEEAIRILLIDGGKFAPELCDLLDNSLKEQCIIDSKKYACGVKSLCD